MKELLRNKEHALNLAALADQELVALAGTPGAQDPLASLMHKLNIIAQRPEDSRESPVEFTDDEQQQLVPLMGKLQRGLNAVKSAEEFVSDEDIETIVRIIALNPDPGHEAIRGILTLNDYDSSSRDRVSRALKVYAYLEPDRYREIVDHLSRVRNHAKKDWSTLEEVFKRTDQFGLDRATVVDALEYDDWYTRLANAIAARTGGPGILKNLHRLGARQGLASLGPAVQEYRSRNADRATSMGEISGVLREVFMHPGVAGRLLTQEALQPGAPDATVRAHSAAEDAKRNLRETINNSAALNTSLTNRFGTHPMWAHRNIPAVANSLAREWCQGEALGALNLASASHTRGGFWAGLWTLLSSLLGVAYDGADVSRVSRHIQAMR